MQGSPFSKHFFQHCFKQFSKQFGSVPKAWCPQQSATVRMIFAVTMLTLGLCSLSIAREPTFDTARTIGTLTNPALAEISGLAASLSSAKAGGQFFWAINDSGNQAKLYIIDQAGKVFDQLVLKKLGNHDWEDLETFTIDEQRYIAVGDIGDNFARRKVYYVHLIPEPDVSQAGKIGQIAPQQIKTIAFQYPEGPLDAESMTVDVVNKRILILGKQPNQAPLYSLPLVLEPKHFVYKAQKLTTLPMLGKLQLSKGNWLQRLYGGAPTSMTVLTGLGVDQPDQTITLAVLSYDAVSIVELSADTQQAKLIERISLPKMAQAEALAQTRWSPLGLLIMSEKNDVIVTIDALKR